MNCDHLDKFEEKHVISILMYVAGNPGCKKTDIYDAVSRNPRMPEKIEILESMGLMTLTSTDAPYKRVCLRTS